MSNLNSIPNLVSNAVNLPKPKVSGVSRSRMTCRECVSQCHVASSGDRNVPDTGSSLQLPKKTPISHPVRRDFPMVVMVVVEVVEEGGFL